MTAGSSVGTGDLTSMEEAIYEQSFRALDEQTKVLEALQARAGLLAAGASVATAFLGGLAGARSDTTVGVHPRAALDSLTSGAIGLFVAVVVISLIVMAPQRGWASSHHPHHLANVYLDRARPVTLAHYRRTITYYNGRNVDANARQLRRLLRLLAVASFCVAFELVLWLWILAT